MYVLTVLFICDLRRKIIIKKTPQTKFSFISFCTYVRTHTPTHTHIHTHPLLWREQILFPCYLDHPFPPSSVSVLPRCCWWMLHKHLLGTSASTTAAPALPRSRQSLVQMTLLCWWMRTFPLQWAKSNSEIHSHMERGVCNSHFTAHHQQLIAPIYMQSIYMHQ